jgi:hypothetical protein
VLKRQGGRHPIYSALGIATPIMRTCAALAAIEREWHRIVGYALAQRSRPISYENGVLVVVVQGHSALQDMNFKKRQFIAEIRKNAWLDLSDMRIEPGHPGRLPIAVAFPPRARCAAPAKIDPAALERLSCEILSNHPDLDPDLAASIARCRLMSARDGGKKRQR